MEVMRFSEDLYNEGLSCLDFIDWINYSDTIEKRKKNEIILCFNTIKSEFRSEKLLLLYLMDFLYLRSNAGLKSVFTI
jgi:hypothetical protein